MKRVLFTAAVFSFALLGAAQAQTIGTATTDLNLRSGPGPEQPVIGFIKARQKANILGCIEGSLWCQVTFRGKQGWAYSQYMSLQAGSGRIVVREPANIASVPIVTYDALGYRTPTYRADVAPLAEAITANATGDVVVGARLPQTVTLNNVPDYRYQYVYVNDTPVLVDPATRQIVYVFN